MDRDRHGENKGPFLHNSHRRPVSRRQFLGQGFLTGAAMVAAPSLLNILAAKAGRAAVGGVPEPACGIGGALGNRVPFFVIDLGGGASTAGSNVIIGTNTQTDGLLTEAGYMKMGLPLAMTPISDPGVIDQELGLAFHNTSPMLDGIRARTSQTTRDRVNGAIFCARSDNDTGNNPHNPMYGMYGAGLDGQVVTLIGTRSSDSGGRSLMPMSHFDPTVRPTKVDRPEDATGLVDTGQLIELLDQDDAAAVMLAAQNITDRKVGAITEALLVEELVQCGFRETTDLVTRFGDPTAFDPSLDAQINAIFPEGIDARSEYRKTASVMKLVTNRLAGAGTVEFGGYDYHDSTRATGERKDRIAGECMGAIMEYAANRVDGLGNPDPTPVVIYVLTDGSVSSDGTLDNSQDGGGKGIWRGDNSSTAGTFMLVYDPTGRPSMTGVGNMVGRFQADGSVDRDAAIFGDDVTRLADTIVLNYAALHGAASVTAFAGGDYIPQGLGSTPGELDPITAFQTLPSFGGPVAPPIP